MHQFETHAGFSISENKLQLVEVAFDGNEFYLKNLNEVYFNEPLLMKDEKETKILSLLQSAFNELIITTPLSTNKVSFSLPLNLFHAIQLPFDNTLLYKDLMYEFQWEFSVMFPHLSSDDLVIQFYEIEKNFFVSDNNAIVVAMNRKYIKSILDFCKRNHLQLSFIDNTHFAADRTLMANNLLNQDAVVVSLAMSQNILSIELLFYGKPFFCKWFNIKDVSEIIPSIKNVLTSVSSLKHEQINYAVYFGEEFGPTLLSQIQESLNISIKPVDPFLHLHINDELKQTNKFIQNASHFSSAAGIAFRIS